MSSSKSPQPRTFKLQEFFAHTEPVNCCSLGKKSCRVLATGGDDCRVNVWKLGKRKPLMSLTGHTTQVDFVLFDPPEEVVAGGSRGGTIKLWDLVQQKMVRSLAGHRASVTSCDFHPYGDYFVSGSADTNLKVWDTRKKKCITTYKDHQAAVTVVKHSPDGRWIVSGDRDGVVKVWDLTAGKKVKDFALDKVGPVRSLAFHPNEFLLAVPGAGRTVYFWDLECFDLVGKTPHETSELRYVAFDPEGEALLAASQDGLKTWGWEPIQCLDHVDTNWNGLHDLSQSRNNELIGVSLRDNIVSLYLVDLKLVQPFKKLLKTKGAKVENPAAMSKVRYTADPRGKGPAPPTVSPTVRQTKSNPAPEGRPSTPPAPADANALGERFDQVVTSPFVNFARGGANAAPRRTPVAVPKQRRPPAQTTPAAAPMNFVPLRHQQRHRTPVAEKTTDPVPNVVVLPKAAPPAEVVKPAVREPPPNPTPVHKVETPVTHVTPARQREARPSNPRVVEAPVEEKESRLIATPDPHQGRPIGLDIREFASQQGTEPEPALDSEEIRKTVSKDHVVMVNILTQRLTNVRVLNQLWKQGNVVAVVRTLRTLNDLPVAQDFLRAAAGTFKSKLLTLNISVDLLPVIKSLLGAQFEEYVRTALQYLILVLHSFSQLIVDTRAAPLDATNISQAERLQRCNVLLELCTDLQPLLDPLQKKHKGVSTEARQAAALLRVMLERDRAHHS